MPNELKGKKFYSIIEINTFIELPSYQLLYEELDRANENLVFADLLSLRDINGNPYIVSGILKLNCEKIKIATDINKIREKLKGIKIWELDQEEINHYNSHTYDKLTKIKPKQELTYYKVIYRLFSTQYSLSKDKYFDTKIEFNIDANTKVFIFHHPNVPIDSYYNSFFNVPKNPHKIRFDLIRYTDENINKVNKLLLSNKVTSSFNFLNKTSKPNKVKRTIKKTIETNLNIQNITSEIQKNSVGNIKKRIITPSRMIAENNNEEKERIFYQVLKEAGIKELPVHIDGENTKLDSKAMLWDKMNEKNSELFPTQRNINK